MRFKSDGFTLIELLIVIAIIGILAAIAIPQFDQYRTRGYDAVSKQGLRDMSLLCNAYWIDNDCTQTCDISKIKDAAYGFNQTDKIIATMPPAPCASFCASAKHTSSPNTYSINDKSVLSTGAGCQNQAQPPQVVLTKSEQTVQKFDSNCQLLQETAALCSSQSDSISHVDDEGSEWTMNCPVTDEWKAREYYRRLLGENAINGGKDSNVFYQTEEGPGHQPHNKTCCYNVHDGFQPQSSAYGFQASTKDEFSKDKFSGICGLVPTAGKSGSLSMLCNMGQEDGETQFSNCEVNVF
jgi:type IV pilus assembly protein PilA